MNAMNGKPDFVLGTDALYTSYRECYGIDHNAERPTMDTLRGFFNRIRFTVLRWESQSEYARKVHSYIQTLPDTEDEFWAGFNPVPTQRPMVIDHKANYELAKDPIVNLQRHMLLLKDDVETHSRFGYAITDLQAYVVNFYGSLLDQAEQVLFDDFAKPVWSNVQRLEAVGFIVHLDRYNNRLNIRFGNYCLVV